MHYSRQAAKRELLKLHAEHVSTTLSHVLPFPLRDRDPGTKEPCKAKRHIE